MQQLFHSFREIGHLLYCDECTPSTFQRTKATIDVIADIAAAARP
jgi:hypothetical protein